VASRDSAESLESFDIDLQKSQLMQGIVALESLCVAPFSRDLEAIQRFERQEREEEAALGEVDKRSSARSDVQKRMSLIQAVFDRKVEETQVARGVP